MEINESIKILTEWDILSAHEVDIDLRNAVKLGTEALKWRLHCEKMCGPDKYQPLPGETEED